MWEPTHVQVTVQKAAGLLIKGKNNTNDCFVTIALGKTKYQTSVKEKSGPQVEWHEECELPIPEQGNKAEIILTALHHNFLGVDEFLGRVVIPLNSLDIYERPKNRLFPLQSKAGHEGKSKNRGQLEVKIGFTVKSGSLTNLSKKEKHKSSVGQLAQSVGGSLLSLGSAEKRKGIKKFAKSIGSKMHLKGKKKSDSDDGASSIGSIGSLNTRTNLNSKLGSKQTFEDADPGVVSDEDEFTFDDLSHKSSASSLSVTVIPPTASPAPVKHKPIELNTSPQINLRRHSSLTLPPAKPPRSEPKSEDEWESKLFGSTKSRGMLRPGSSESLNRRSWDSSKLVSQIDEEPNEIVENNNKTETLPPKPNETVIKKEEKDGMFTKFKNFRRDKNDVNTKQDPIGNSNERIIIGGENDVKENMTNNRISHELLQKFEGKSREELILGLLQTQSDLEKQKKKLKDLEDYLDDLLLRVMETTPRILQNPYVACKLTHKKFTS